MTDLVRYDAACKAIAEARTVDEAKELRDKAEAIRAYAKQAKNRSLEIDAAEIRIRAERRLGFLIAEQRDTIGMNPGGRPKTRPEREQVPEPPTLSDAGIDRKLSSRAQQMAAVPEADFNALLTDWRSRIEIENERVTTILLRAGERAQQGRRENDLYPTPHSLIAEIISRWKPRARKVWEPCFGDGRVARAMVGHGYDVVSGDIASGDDFFAYSEPPQPGIALCTNPPFDRVREFIDHAFAIGIEEMCLVLPERLWACDKGRKQLERHRPVLWANMDWREDYLGKGGSADRALAVAIWDGSCAPACMFDVWTRRASADVDLPADEHGMVRVSDSHVVHKDFVTQEERVALVPPLDLPETSESAESLKSDLPPHDPETGEIIENGASAARPKPFTFDIKPAVLRPHCLHPEMCAGYGSNHCGRCRKAMEQAEASK